MSVELRHETAADAAFLQRLITETIAIELGADVWPEPMRTQLLGIQYQNRRMGPRTGFPEGESFVIQWNGADAGWIYTVKAADGLHIVELMVLPGVPRARRGNRNDAARDGTGKGVARAADGERAECGSDPAVRAAGISPRGRQ